MIAKMEPMVEASVEVAMKWMKDEVDDVLVSKTKGYESTGRVVKVLNRAELYFDE